MKKKSILTCSQVTSYLCTLILLILSLWGCTLPGSKTVQSVQKTDIYFDTVVSITLYGTTDDTLLNQAMTLCADYEALLSRTVEGSDIYRINHSQGKPVKVSPETLYLIKESINYSKQTEGAVDITIAPVRDLWDFHNTNPSAIPKQDVLIQALSHVDYHTIHLDETNQTVTLSDPEAQIDLGFIAKGYIADKLKEYFISQGVTSALINLGGNVITIGTKPDGSPFQIGIEKPFETTATMDIVSVTDRSVVTSGIYQRYFEIDNTIYHHILDTKTGYPASGDILSVTILSDSSMVGDALSTSCFLLGVDGSKKLLAHYDNIEAIFITKDYEIIKLSQP